MNSKPIGPGAVPVARLAIASVLGGGLFAGISYLNAGRTTAAVLVGLTWAVLWFAGMAVVIRLGSQRVAEWIRGHPWKPSAVFGLFVATVALLAQLDRGWAYGAMTLVVLFLCFTGLARAHVFVALKVYDYIHARRR